MAGLGREHLPERIRGRVRGTKWGIQVFAKSFLFTNKTQNLEAEKLGHNSVEVGLRDQKDQNCWRIVA